MVQGVEGVVTALVVHGLGLKLEMENRKRLGCSAATTFAGSLDRELIVNALEVVLSKQ